ncbi:very short patch repair endonuclease [bacterium]|nr:very short patch repair endonuclease [bacterium]
MKNDFWKKKIENTRVRDKRTTAYLRKKNWKVVRIWGHEVKKDLEKTIEKVQIAI